MRRWCGMIICILPGMLAIAFLLFPLLRFEFGAIEWSIIEPALRSALVACTSTILSGALGLILGWFFFRYQAPEAVAAWLLAPFCLGSAAWAVLYLPFISSLPGVATRDSLSVLSVLIIVNVLQYAPLLAYVCHQSMTRTAVEREGLVAGTQMTPGEATKFVFWPDQSRFFIFVAAIIFCATFGEYEKALIYFRASAGTDTSLVPQAMRDLYISLNGFHDIALAHVISTSVVIVAASSLLLLATLFLCVGLCRMLLKYLAGLMGLPSARSHAQNHADTPTRRVLVWGPLLLLGLSCLWSGFVSDGLIVRALFPVAIASLLATVFYTAYSFVLRLSDAPLWGQEQASARWWFAGSLLLVRLIPGALLFYLIISYTVTLEQEAEIVRWIAWFLAHLLYNSVVILPFLVLMLLRVPNSELEFMRASTVSSWDVSKVSLFSRFWRELLTVFVFVFVLVWNGDAANSAMSSVFQSVNLEIVTKLHGRQYDRARVFELIIPTATLALLAVGLLGSQGSFRVRKPSTSSDCRQAAIVKARNPA